MTDQELHIEITELEGGEEGAIALVKVDGRITVMESERFAHKIEVISSIKPAVAILDCEKLEFITSAGIGELIKLSRMLEGNKASMMLANVNEDVSKLFEQSKLDAMMPIYTDVEAAMTQAKMRAGA
ncbi:MAG: STAS domain-containing protein [Planctomycetota bacterium]